MRSRYRPYPSAAIDWQKIGSESYTFLSICGLWAQNAAATYCFCPFLREFACRASWTFSLGFLVFHFHTTWQVSSVMLSPAPIENFAFFLKLPPKVSLPPPSCPGLRAPPISDCHSEAPNLALPRVFSGFFGNPFFEDILTFFSQSWSFHAFYLRDKKIGHQGPVEGSVINNCSRMYCFKLLGQWAALTCVFMYFKTVYLSENILSGTWGASYSYALIMYNFISIINDLWRNEGFSWMLFMTTEMDSGFDLSFLID